MIESGKKQHHIPQSLQRGFLFDVKAEKTYVHRGNGGNFPASISDVLAQRYFYSRLSSDGSKTLDGMITEYENRLGGLLIKLRSIPVDGEADADVAAEVIAHLTPRSANVRRIFGSGVEQLMTATAKAFADEDTVVTMLGLAEPEPNSTWNDHIARMLDKEPNLKTLLELSPIPKSLLDRMIFMAAKEHFVGSFDAKLFAELGANMGARWKGEVDAVIHGVKASAFRYQPLPFFPLNSRLQKGASLHGDL